MLKNTTARWESRIIYHFGLGSQKAQREKKNVMFLLFGVLSHVIAQISVHFVKYASSGIIFML